jgi:prepilin-type N-terminal cleavage/methylation domain-containing protein
MQLKRRDDRGVTLTEVMMAVIILAIILVPLGNALIAFFRNTNATNNRFIESDDAQLAAAYFAQDVQSIGVRDWSAPPYPTTQSVETNASPTGGVFPCGAAGMPDAVLRMAWDDPTSVSGTRLIVVSYMVRTVSGEQQLHRLRCVGSTTPESDLVLAHNVFSVGSPVITGPNTNPQAITFTVNIKAPTNTGSALVVTLSGQRRQT